MSKRVLLYFLSLFMVLILIGCTSSTETAGGSDMPNGKITVAVSGAEEEKVTAHIQGVVLTGGGDSLFYEKELEITNGSIDFSNVPSGNYVITIFNEDSSKGAVLSDIVIEPGAKVSITERVSLQKTVSISGKIAAPLGDMVVYMPGLNKKYEMSDNVSYHFDNVPLGKQHLVFIWKDTIANVLPFEIIDMKKDEYLLYDLWFDTIGDEVYDYYATNLSKIFEMRRYSYKSIPAWYVGKDFSGITYFDGVNPIEEKKTPQWNFPIIVGVTDTTASFYGGLDSIGVKIEEQLKKAETVFRQEGISGEITFSVDSLYIITGTVNDENMLPPEGFSLRILYDGLNEGKLGNWIDKNRVLIRNGAMETLFSEYAQLTLHWGLGLFRGCANIGYSEVGKNEDSLAGIGFSEIGCIMNIRNDTLWKPYNIFMINANGGSFERIANPAAYFPDSIGVSVVDSAEKGLPKATIRCYGVNGGKLTSVTEPLYEGISDENGYYWFPRNPFVTDGKIAYHTIAVEVIYTDQKSYGWIPYYHVSEQWIEKSSQNYILPIQMEVL